MSILWPRLASPRLRSRTAAATPPTFGSSVWTNCKIFSVLDNKTFRPLKIFAFGRQLFDRARRHSSVKLMRFGEAFVHQRFRAHHAKIRKHAATQQNAIGSDKTIIANLDRLRSLTVPLDVDAVRHDLRGESCDGAEFADRDRVRAIDEMTMGDGGMFADNQLRPSVGFFSEMPRRPERKTGNPVAASDHRVCFEMKQVQALAKREMIDPSVFFHDQSCWIDPREPNPRSRMNLVTELLFQKRSAQSPRQKKAEEHYELSHNGAPRLR